MATNIPGLRPTLPSKFLELPGEPPISFKIWLSLVNDYFYLIDATSTNALSDRQKNIILMSVLGAEGARLSASHPDVISRDTVKHSVFVSALSSIFAKTVPPIRACYDFLNRKQGHDESANDFLLALRSLVPDCQFSDQEKRMLAIAFTLGCRHKPTQEKLLAQQSIDLDEFLRIAEADESARENATVIRGENYVENVNKVHSRYRASTGTSSNKPTTVSQNKSPNKSCSGCGSRTHS